MEIYEKIKEIFLKEVTNLAHSVLFWIMKLI